MDHIHPTVVRRKAQPRAKVLRGTVPLDMRLLEWPQRHEIRELFREAQQIGKTPRLPVPAANENLPDEVG